MTKAQKDHIWYWFDEVIQAKEAEIKSMRLTRDLLNQKLESEIEILETYQKQRFEYVEQLERNYEEG